MRDTFDLFALPSVGVCLHRLSTLKRRTKTHKDTDNFLFVTVWRSG
jgi:hypothetical protein